MKLLLSIFIQYGFLIHFGLCGQQQITVAAVEQTIPARRQHGTQRKNNHPPPPSNAPTFPPLLPLPPFPHLELPDLPITWCDKLKTSETVTPISLSHLADIPRNSLILIIGDSTLHSPFLYIAHCLFHQQIDVLESESLPTGTFPRILSVNSDTVQVLFYANWAGMGSQPYSDPQNRIAQALPRLLGQYANPGMVPYAVITNFALLHILQRVPLENNLRVGDIAGWTNLEPWVISDSTLLASHFPALVLSTPNAICLSKLLPLTQRAWAVQYTKNNASLDACEKYYPGIDGATFCRFGAAIPVDVDRLSSRFINIIQTGLTSVRDKLGNRFGWLDSHNLTSGECALTTDGQHYLSVVPTQIEAILRFLVAQS